MSYSSKSPVTGSCEGNKNVRCWNTSEVRIRMETGQHAKVKRDRQNVGLLELY